MCRPHLYPKISIYEEVLCHARQEQFLQGLNLLNLPLSVHLLSEEHDCGGKQPW